MRFHGFQGPEVRSLCRRFANGMLPLKKPLLGSSYLLASIHRFIGSGGWAGRLAGWLAGWLRGWWGEGVPRKSNTLDAQERVGGFNSNFKIYKVSDFQTFNFEIPRFQDFEFAKHVGTRMFQYVGLDFCSIRPNIIFSKMIWYSCNFRSSLGSPKSREFVWGYWTCPLG